MYHGTVVASLQGLTLPARHHGRRSANRLVHGRGLCHAAACFDGGAAERAADEKAARKIGSCLGIREDVIRERVLVRNDADRKNSRAVQQIPFAEGSHRSAVGGWMHRLISRTTPLA